MGKDGNSGANSNFALDAFGFSLGYFNGDYEAITYSQPTASDYFLADKTGSDLDNNTTNLYNGNISSMVTTITTPVTFSPEPSFETLAQSNAYTYDRLNRLRESKSFANLDYSTNEWMNSGNPYDGRYHNQFTYNANGGMLTALAKNALGETIDNQTYHRATTTNGRYINNRTYAITDVATQTSGEDLLDQQAFDNIVLSNNNYGFTEIGERNKNLSEDIESITWTVYGKKAAVKRTVTSGKNNVIFNYDPQNNRIAKHIYTSDDIWINSEYYVRDAQGNLMATYRLEASSGSGLSYELTERHIYGSNSIGINTTPVEMIGANTPTDTYPHIIGDKRFNGSNHLGNVLSVFTDKKLPLDIDNNGIIDGYLPQVISANDYAPFGSRLSERTFNKELYPNSFNGKRESAELDGEQNYGERDYNPKGREFDKPDPFKKISPNQSPYIFAGNSPIKFIDYNGGFRLDPAVAEQYPHLEIVLNAISDLVENSTDAQLLANPIIRQFIGAAPRINRGKSATVLRHIKDILTNGKGPFVSISEPSEVVNGQLGVTTVLPNKEGKSTLSSNVDVFINRELLDAAEGINVNSGSRISLLNGDQIASMLALYETLLHEAVHVQAKSLGISEGGEGIELGNIFSQGLNPSKNLLGNPNNPSSTLGQQQLNRGTDPSNFGFSLNRLSVSNFFSRARSVGSARKPLTQKTQRRINKNRKSTPRFR